MGFKSHDALYAKCCYSRSSPAVATYSEMMLPCFRKRRDAMRRSMGLMARNPIPSSSRGGCFSGTQPRPLDFLHLFLRMFCQHMKLIWGSCFARISKANRGHDMW